MKDVFYRMNYSELRIMANLGGMNHLFGPLSDSEKVTKAQLAMCLFGMTSKNMVVNNGDSFVLTDEYRELIDSIREASECIVIRSDREGFCTVCVYSGDLDTSVIVAQTFAEEEGLIVRTCSRKDLAEYLFDVCENERETVLQENTQEVEYPDELLMIQYFHTDTGEMIRSAEVWLDDEQSLSVADYGLGKSSCSREEFTKDFFA